MPYSPLTTPYLAAALITVICVVLTLNVAALKDASVGSVAFLVLLLVALLIFTIIIWRQPQSNARLNFKVSAAPYILVSAPPGLHQDLGIAGSARACWQPVTRKALKRLSLRCSPHCGSAWVLWAVAGRGSFHWPVASSSPAWSLKAQLTQHFLSLAGSFPASGANLEHLH